TERRAARVRRTDGDRRVDGRRSGYGTDAARTVVAAAAAACGSGGREGRAGNREVGRPELQGGELREPRRARAARAAPQAGVDVGGGGGGSHAAAILPIPGRRQLGGRPPPVAMAAVAAGGATRAWSSARLTGEGRDHGAARARVVVLEDGHRRAVRLHPAADL